MYSVKVKNALKKAGWSNSRNIPTKLFKESLQAKGYIVSDSVINFLASYGNLELTFPSSFREGDYDSISFNVEKALTEVSHDWILEDYSNKIGTKLCLIGQGFKNHMSFSMDEKGRVLGGLTTTLSL